MQGVMVEVLRELEFFITFESLARTFVKYYS